VARPVKAGVPLTRAKVEYFGDRKVPLVARKGVKVPLRRGQRARTVVDAPEELKGPIPAGTRVGSVSVFKEGQRVRVLPLETGEAVPEAGFLRRLVHSPVFWFFLLGSVALLALAARRRAARRRRRREARKRGNRARRVVT
jgi:D-alanyl-D-alanine carboxypeptidase (penicillin-binding protein 5/6)